MAILSNGGLRDVTASVGFFCPADSCILSARDDLWRRFLYRAREQAGIVIL